MLFRGLTLQLPGPADHMKAPPPLLLNSCDYSVQAEGGMPVHVYINIYTYLRTYCTYVSMYTCIYIYVHVCMMYTHVYKHIYICT